MRDIIERYMMDGDADRAYGDLVSGNWAKTFPMRKTKQQMSAFKEHVNLFAVLYMYFVFVTWSMVKKWVYKGNYMKASR